MKNVHVFVPVFLYAVTMLIFQIKRIISSEKWCNYVVTFFFFFENAKQLGRSDNGLALLYLVDLFINKLKTKFNNLFYRTILNTKRIHNSF